MDFDFTNLFDRFYHTRFFVLICTAIFCILFSLQLDETIQISYWIVFLPLWIWKATAFLGLVVGTIVWFRHTRKNMRRNLNSGYLIFYDRDVFVQFKSMLLSFLTNLILLMFELIVCDKLNYKREFISWSLCFIPLYILSLLSIAITIWSIRYDRSYELELFCSINVLQFVFIGLRLDNTIYWSWILVMIPTWVCISIGFIILFYISVISICVTGSIRNTSREVTNDLSTTQQTQQDHQIEQPRRTHRHVNSFRFKQNWINLCLKMFFLSSLLGFFILLVTKLDGEKQFDFYYSYQYQNSTNYRISYFMCIIPLLISHLCLLLLSFSNRTGNVWWFGIQKDVCEYFMDWFPFMKLYGNIKYASTPLSLSSREQTESGDNSSLITFTNQNRQGEDNHDDDDDDEMSNNNHKHESKLKRFFRIKNSKNQKNEFNLCSKNNQTDITGTSLKSKIFILDLPD